MSEEPKAPELDSPMKAVADLDLTQPTVPTLNNANADANDDTNAGDDDDEGEGKTGAGQSRRFFPR